MEMLRSCFGFLLGRKTWWWNELYQVVEAMDRTHAEVRGQRRLRKREARALRQQSIKLCESGSLDLAVKYLEQELEIRCKLGDTVRSCQVWLLMGKVLRARGNSEAAVGAFESCISLLTQTRQPEIAFEALCELSTTLRAMGDVDKAISHAERCLALGECLNDENGIAMAHEQLGTIYQAMGNVEEALKHHMLAVRDDVAEDGRGGGGWRAKVTSTSTSNVFDEMSDSDVSNSDDDDDDDGEGDGGGGNYRRMRGGGGGKSPGTKGEYSGGVNGDDDDEEARFGTVKSSSNFNVSGKNAAVGRHNRYRTTESDEE